MRGAGMLDAQQVKAYADTIPDDWPCKEELILAYLSAGAEQLKREAEQLCKQMEAGAESEAQEM